MPEVKGYAMKEFEQFDAPMGTQPTISQQIPLSTTNDVDRPKTNPEWLEAKTRGRWAKYFDPKTRTYNPPSSDARKKARRQKTRWTRLTNPTLPEYVPVELCMSGTELLAERARMGDGTSFRRPRTDEARALVALLPHGRVRLAEALALVALAYAMLERQRRGLIATADELGELLGLRETATGEVMARLIALGWVRADATYTRYGACESQRGNLWRLTAQAAQAFALLVPHGVVLPQGTVDPARLRRRRTYKGSVGSRAGATPRNPGTNPDSVQEPEKISDPFRNTPRSVGASGVVSTSSTIDCRTAVPAATAVPALPATRQGETRDVVGGLRTEMVRIDDALERVRRGDVDRRHRRSPDATKRPLRDDERVAERELERVRREHVRDVAGDVFAELAELVSDPEMRAAALDARKGGAS